MRLLLVEDAVDVAEAVVQRLTRRGYAVDHALSVEQAEDCIAVQDYDAAILDIGLPDGSGTEVLEILRASRKSTPILMLSARTKVDERVSALDSGADDYLVKPFDLRELEARLRALLRRNSPDREGTIRFGDLVFDPAGPELAIGDRPVALTRREYSLLEILLANRGRTIAKEKILEKMFAFNEDPVGLNAVELYVARLRRKLDASCVEIRTLRGIGYQIVAAQ